MSDDHGRCPKCDADLNGGSIWETFYNQALTGAHYRMKGAHAEPDEAERLADESAAAYGATRTHGQWGRAIGMSDMDKDRIVSWRCPDCEHEWAR